MSLYSMILYSLQHFKALQLHIELFRDNEIFSNTAAFHRLSCSPVRTEIQNCDELQGGLLDLCFDFDSLLRRAKSYLANLDPNLPYSLSTQLINPKLWLRSARNPGPIVIGVLILLIV